MGKVKNGISLISLIITIIVIIILAAIVIFTGLNTPDSAQFAKFCQSVDNVQMAVTNKYADLKTKHAISRESRTDEQIYLEIARNNDEGMYSLMGTTTVKSQILNETSTGIQNILPEESKESIGMELPKVREYNTAWYVTKEGKVFNANGYTYNGKTYFDARHYEEGELDSNGTNNSDRVERIAKLISNETGIVASTSSWTYDHANQKVTNGTLTLNIGDYVNTDEYTVDGKTFDGKFRVLGEENGKLLLVTANYVDFQGSTGPTGTPLLILDGAELAVDGEEKMFERAIAKLNAYGAMVANANSEKLESGRSINVEDINKITGYNPMEARTNINDLTQKTPFFNDGSIDQYKNNVTYTMKKDGTEDYVYYKKASETTETRSGYKKFWLPGTDSNITEPFTIQSTCYVYYPETYGQFPATAVASGQTMEGISSASPAYDMLFKPQSNIPYWLASPCVSVDSGRVYWSLFFVIPPGTVAYDYLWDSNYGSHSGTYGVRPAVSLKSDIVPELISTDSTTGISTYSF